MKMSALIIGVLLSQIAVTLLFESPPEKAFERAFFMCVGIVIYHIHASTTEYQKGGFK